MKNERTCPVCGSSSTKSVPAIKEVQLDFFQGFSIPYEQLACGTCGFTGEDKDSYQVSYKEQRKISNSEVAKYMTIKNKEKGIKDVHFERAFRLSPRTINRWKVKDTPSDAALALLKVVNTYDWIVDVADHGYDPDFAREMLIAKGLEELNNTRVEHGATRAWVKIGDGNSHTIAYSGSFPEPQAESSHIFYGGTHMPLKKVS